MGLFSKSVSKEDAKMVVCQSCYQPVPKSKIRIYRGNRICTECMKMYEEFQKSTK